MNGSSCENLTRDFLKRQKINRRHNALALIADFLRCEGLVETAASLSTECPVSNHYQLCDNVGLDTVLQDFEAYYQLRYQRQPLVARRTEQPLAPVQKTRRKSITTDACASKSKDPSCGDNANSSREHTGCVVRGIACSSSTDSSVRESTAADSLTDVVRLANTGDIRTPKLESAEHRELVALILDEVLEHRDTMPTFDDIVGLDSQKLVITEAVLYPARFPDLFHGLTAPWKSVLLFGPPGNGKTMLARAISRQFGGRQLFSVSVATVTSKWRGESEKLVRLVFQLACLNAPSVVFIDEVDCLSSQRNSLHEHEASRRFKSELLRQLDILSGARGDHVTDVLFVAATNLPWDIDGSFLRRMEKRVLVNVPSAEQRRCVMQRLMRDRQMDDDVDWEAVATATEGYSVSDIRLVCREAAMSSLRRLAERAISVGTRPHPDAINHASLMQAISRCKPSGGIELRQYVHWNNKNASS